MSKEKKHICVIGLGNFGGELAVRLARRYEVLAIDHDEIKVNKISDHVQQALIMDVRDYASLKSATTGFDEAIVSMGESMESSILCTLHLKKIGIKSIWAKAFNDDHSAILQSVGATQVIFPERETARRVAAQITNPNLLDFVPLKEDYRVIEVAPPASFCGKTLKDLRLRNRFDVFVLAVRQLVPEAFVFLPKPDLMIKDSDILVLIGHEENLLRIQDAKNEPEEEPEGETDSDSAQTPEKKEPGSEESK